MKKLGILLIALGLFGVFACNPIHINNSGDTVLNVSDINRRMVGQKVTVAGYIKDARSVKNGHFKAMLYDVNGNASFDIILFTDRSNFYKFKEIMSDCDITKHKDAPVVRIKGKVSKDNYHKGEQVEIKIDEVYKKSPKMLFVFVAIIGLGILICVIEFITQHKREQMSRKMMTEKNNANDTARAVGKLYERMKLQEAKLDTVKQQTITHGKQIIDMTKQVDNTNNRLDEIDNGSQHIAETQIRKYFDEALNGAERELDIISPWISHAVVNGHLINRFRGLLKKGVHIKIVYGIGDEQKDKRTQTSIEIASKLKSVFREFNNFRIQRDNTHDKLFICDDKFYVISSLNILSKGIYNKSCKEMGEYSTNVNSIRKYREEYFNF